MNRELQRWTIIIALTAFAFGVLGAFVPEWVHIMPYRYTFGVRQMCVGGYCGALNYTILEDHPLCRNGCHSPALIRRWRAVEAFIWIAAASSFAVVVLIMLGFRRDLLHTARMMGPILFFAGLAVVSYVISLAIFGSTLVLHSNPWQCRYASGCFYYGASSIVAFTGMCISGIAFLLALLSLLGCASRVRGALLAWVFLMSILTTAIAMGAALSPKWVILSLPYTSIQESFIAIGPLNTCYGGRCRPTDRTWLAAGSCATPGGLRSRFGAATFFIIAGFVMSVFVALFAFLNWPAITFMAIVLTLAFYIVGIAVHGDTWDWYLFCGETYCDMVTLRTGAECQYGFAMAAAVTAVLLTAILLFAFIIMFACRKADRAPDTTQVAVTTVARPPALPVGPRPTA